MDRRQTPENFALSFLKEHPDELIRPEHAEPAQARHETRLLQAVRNVACLLAVVAVAVAFIPSVHRTQADAERQIATADRIAWEGAVDALLHAAMRAPERLVIESYGTPTAAYSDRGRVTFSHVSYRARDGSGRVARSVGWVARVDETDGLSFFGARDWVEWKRRVHFRLMPEEGPSSPPSAAGARR